jgi:hypothetical protein
MHGVDVLAVNSLIDLGALELAGGTGTDRNNWETVEHFISWFT